MTKIKILLTAASEVTEDDLNSIRSMLLEKVDEVSDVHQTLRDPIDDNIAQVIVSVDDSAANDKSFYAGVKKLMPQKYKSLDAFPMGTLARATLVRR